MPPTATATRPAPELLEPETPGDLVVAQAPPRDPRVEVLPAEALQPLDVGPAPARRHDPRTSPEFTPFAASEDITQLLAALAVAALGFEEIERNREADVKSRRENAASFKYRYATLGEVIRATKPSLLAQGLNVLQMPAVRQRTVTIITVLAHTSGQWIRNDLPTVVNSLDPQTIGTAMSYMRRYARLSILDLAPEDSEDDDFNESHTQDRRPEAGNQVRTGQGQGPVSMPQRAQPTSPQRGASAGAPRAASPEAPATAAANPNPAPAPASFTITALEGRQKKDKTPYWVVGFSNGLVACTFRREFAEQLTEARDRGTRFTDAVTTRKGDWIFLDSMQAADGGQ